MDRLMAGVSGVRGVVGETMTPQVACQFASAFASMLDSGVTVTIGRDTRPSGPALRNASAAGLLASGVNVVDLGVVSTPGAALMTAKIGAAGGVVITASHNPGRYNGLKFLRSGGEALRGEQALELKRVRQRGEFAYVRWDRQGTETANDRANHEHVRAVCDRCDAEAVARRKFTVVLDSVNGAGCLETPMLLERLGCNLVHINAEPSGIFAHEPEPVESNLSELCRAVRRCGAAAGFAQDADADRLAIVDENGRFVGEEYTLALSAAFVLSGRKGAIATNLSTSRMVDDIAARAGCRVVRAPTGEANVVEAMKRENCILGGEGGGGVIEPEVVYVRDSLVGIAYVLQYLAQSGKPLSRLVDEIPRYVVKKIRMPVAAGDVPEILARSREAFAAQADARFNDSDGLRVDLTDGWVCVRPSNTEPIIRIIAEAKDEDTASGLVEKVRKIAEDATG